MKEEAKETKKVAPQVVEKRQSKLTKPKPEPVQKASVVPTASHKLATNESKPQANIALLVKDRPLTARAR